RRRIRQIAQSRETKQEEITLIKKVCFHRALHKLLALVSLISASAMPVCAQTPLKREIMVGSDFDSFNFAGPAQGLSLAYRADINLQFTLELDGYGYSRFESGAGRAGLILVRFQVETNYPRPSCDAADSFSVH